MHRWPALRVGYFIAASSVLYIVLVAWLLQPEPAASDQSKAAGGRDGSLARQVRQNAWFPLVVSETANECIHFIGVEEGSHSRFERVQPVAMTKIVHQLWRSRAWVMQYIGFTNNFALAILQYFLPIYCLASRHCALLLLASLRLDNVVGVSPASQTKLIGDIALMCCITVDYTGKVRFRPGANSKCLLCLWRCRRVDSIRCSQTQPTILRGTSAFQLSGVSSSSLLMYS